MKKIIALLFTMAFAVSCQQAQQVADTVTGGTGNCELGAKSGGSTTTTEAECKDLGGRYTG